MYRKLGVYVSWHSLGFLPREIGFAEVDKEAVCLNSDIIFERKIMNHIEFYQAKLNHETDSWDLYEALNNGEPIVVIDARSPEAYALEHIPTSINIPHRTMSEVTTSETQ